MINENVLKIITSTVLSADKNEAITRRQKKVQFFFKYYVMFGIVCNNIFIAVCQVCDYLYNISSYICTEGGCITFPTKSWKKLTFLHLLFQWEKSVLMHSDKIHFKKGVVKKSLFLRIYQLPTFQ